MSECQMSECQMSECQMSECQMTNDQNSKKKIKLYDKQLKNIMVKTPKIVIEAFLKFRVYLKF